MLAYFSARGGEVARPDLVTPGRRVQHGAALEHGRRGGAGDQHGGAARERDSPRCSCRRMAPEKRTPAAREIRQALMVTAQPTPGATIIDEGAGLADVDRAYRWLSTAAPVPDLQVRAVGPGDVSGALLRGVGGTTDTVQEFEIEAPAGAPATTYALRSDAPWLTAPATLALRGARTAVRLKVARRGLAAPGAYVGHGHRLDRRYDGRTRVPAGDYGGRGRRRLAAGTQKLRDSVAVRAGHDAPDLLPGGQRTALRCSRSRPAGAAERALAFLHEPDGMPFRDESARPAGFGPQSAEYEADSRDVVTGPYEAVVVAPPNAGPHRLGQREPVAAPAARDAPRRVGARLADQRHRRSGRGQVGMHLGGAARVESVSATGSAEQRIPFVVPRWSRGVVVDITMDRAQWGRFTDFGVTLFDSLGHQLGKQPLNYAFGRLQVELPEGHGDVPVTLGLFPGFADASGDQRWSLRTSIRVYADTSVVLARADTSEAARSRRTPPRRRTYASGRLPGRSGPKFVPLGLLVARADGRSWTREVELAPPAGRWCHEGERQDACGSPRGRGSGATGSRRRCARCAAGRSTT